MIDVRSDGLASIFIVGIFGAFFVSSVFAEPGDATRGEAVFQQCSVCHQVGADAGNGVGPRLTGVLNRKMGSLPDFAYGTGLKKAAQQGLAWDQEMVFNWLANPQAYIKNLVQDESVTTKMSVKLSDEQARRDVIAYIATFGDK